MLHYSFWSLDISLNKWCWFSLDFPFHFFANLILLSSFNSVLRFVDYLPSEMTKDRPAGCSECALVPMLRLLAVSPPWASSHSASSCEAAFSPEFTSTKLQLPIGGLHVNGKSWFGFKHLAYLGACSADPNAVACEDWDLLLFLNPLKSSCALKWLFSLPWVSLQSFNLDLSNLHADLRRKGKDTNIFSLSLIVSNKTNLNLLEIYIARISSKINPKRWLTTILYGRILIFTGTSRQNILKKC